MAPVLGYWKTRCYAQPIRLLLKYLGIPFEDLRYEVGPPPTYDKTCWFSVKYNLGFDFPNLPYYIDGDVKITQTVAILRYIARQHDMCGRTEQEQIRVDMIVNQAMDFSLALTDVCYYHFERKDEFLAGLPTTIKQFSDFLGEKPWFAGDTLTMADFMMYEFLDQHLVLDSGCLRGATNLQLFMQRFKDLPPIQQYMASPEFMHSPLFNKYAIFGNK
ncbi:glutathione S-transferase Mu 1-like [Homarus americanus]|uniref:glutathione S-transferase Mu 1-like n=1 Tax=Homarus americanus TaxID=6706 RepID=UPI001C44A92E|nr:glutathione S-transferase Mu 1-like [Homarus americanus]